ncbi:hypothetical protein O6H91_01G027300 [Diphasiastrum complanatum]|uniref:Uncharacterized protein n=1 Tax=Diphasiastrum complanatum TaxID=34168 RepID=A0ACC2EPE0_DIPCM|nr:hypothetical protein O6H91_01G027300 [Diphasiastrum complanatum]
MEHGVSTRNPQDLENLDLLRDTKEISVADDVEHGLKIASMLRRAKLGSGSRRQSQKEDKSPAIPYEKQKHTDPYGARAETPFQEIDEDRRCNEFVMCGIMTVILLLALLAFFIVIVYLALHPMTPSIAVRDVLNGTISLITDNANETYVAAAMVLSMQATNPHPKAFTTIQYLNGILNIGYQKQSKAISIPSFDQAAQNATTTFVAHLPPTQLRIGNQMLQNASLEFYQKNISMWVTGTVRAKFKIVGLLSPHVTVYINCSMKINPVDIWTGRPDLLSKTCQ